jgi:DNA-binding transcriptional LysR family regulator
LNFSRAAQRLHIAQPPLSQQIRDLEQELGAQLLERGTRPLRLTEAGCFFRRQSIELLSKLEEAVGGTRRIGVGQEGRLGIGYVGSAMNALLPPVVRRFQAEHPAVEVLMFEMGHDEQEAALLDGRIHLGFLRTPIDIDTLVEELLYEEPMVAAVPSSHLFAQRSEITLSDLAAEPIVLYTSGISRSVDRDYILSAFRAAGIEPKVAVEARNAESALGLVRAGLGVTLTVSCFARPEPEGIQFLSLGSTGLSVPLKAVYRAHEQSFALKTFLKFVRSEAKLVSGGSKRV